jgi:hypothetical protein
MKQTHEVPILTTYRGATKKRGSHIAAKHAGRRVSRAYDHALSVAENHASVARLLGADDTYTQAPLGNGYVFVVGAP